MGFRDLAVIIHCSLISQVQLLVTGFKSENSCLFIALGPVTCAVQNHVGSEFMWFVQVNVEFL